MNTRRKFLIQGSITTTGLLALKPFSAFARLSSPFMEQGGHSNKLVFLHTAIMNPEADCKVIQVINDIKNKNANVILLNAGPNEQDEAVQLHYDASALYGDYEIISKGKFRTGIIRAKAGDENIIEKMKMLSTYLKKEKNCTVVVCLSQLGYQNSQSPDDITLAKKTIHIDIIIGGHPENYKAYPVIALNNNKGEVIIHSASGDSSGFGKIEFEFDGQGRKKNLSFHNHLSDTTTQMQGKKVA